MKHSFSSFHSHFSTKGIHYSSAPVELTSAHTKKNPLTEESLPRKKRSVFVLGPNGSFSAQGAEAFLTQAFPHNQQFSMTLCESFPQVFQSVKENPGALGVVPLQNGSTSSIHTNVDMFFQDPNLRIWAEFLLPIRIHLLGLPGTKKEEITDIFSHPKAFEQCKNFVENFTGSVHFSNSTSAAASNISTSKNKHHGVLGSNSLVSKGLTILQSDIHDHQLNETQFVVFGVKDTAPDFFPKGPKWTVHFECHHTPGALAHVLQLIAAQGGNVMKIESRPIPNQRERFRFWLDIDATHAEETLYQNLKNATVDFQSTGQYAPGGVLMLDTPQTNIALLRRQIDLVDTHIIKLLGQRHTLVDAIVKEKTRIQAAAHQPKRFENMLMTRKAQAQEEGINPHFIEALYNLIHDDSVTYQKKQQTND